LITGKIGDCADGNSKFRDQKAITGQYLIVPAVLYQVQKD